jgi:dephospho-CoA kinase
MKQNKAVVIGITGPAGSGKSYICRLIGEVADTLVIDTDSVAKEQMKKGGISYKKVVDAFGKDILLKSGEIDRAKLSAIVFNDAEKLKLLNSLTHPEVIKESQRLIRENRGRKEVIVLESAILVAANCHKMCDHVWYVYTPQKMRADRLKTTRGYSDEKIKSVMRSQNTDRYFRATSDAVIVNKDGDRPEAVKKIILNKLKKMAKNK